MNCERAPDYIVASFCVLVPTSTETIRTIRDGEPRTATSTFTQLLSSDMLIQVKYCSTSTETIRTIRDGEPRTPTSIFTQLLSSEARRVGETPF